MQLTIFYHLDFQSQFLYLSCEKSFPSNQMEMMGKMSWRKKFKEFFEIIFEVF